MFSLFTFSPIFPGRSADPSCPYVRTPMCLRAARRRRVPGCVTLYRSDCRNGNGLATPWWLMAGFTTSLAWKTPDTLDRWNSRAVKLNGRTSTHTNTHARARRVGNFFHFQGHNREYTSACIIRFKWIRHDDAEHVSSAPPITKFYFKNPRWLTDDALERPVLHHHEILQFVDFQDGGCSSSWNFEIEIFNSRSPQRNVRRYHVKFCGDRSNCWIFVIF